MAHDAGPGWEMAGVAGRTEVDGDEASAVGRNASLTGVNSRAVMARLAGTGWGWGWVIALAEFC